jgi:large subunit ribosomal protein L7/L12
MDPVQREIVELKQRVERLEQMLSQLTQQPLPPLAPLPNPMGALEVEIRDLLARGQEIHAIKLYREHTGCSLAEAQMRVQALK